MSYWVHLENPDTGKPVVVSIHSEGGTFALGGTTEAELNITYNYSGHFRAAGITLRSDDGESRWFRLDGSTGAESIEPLQRAVMQLGVMRDPDYWKATPGNAGYALSILLAWARQHPDAIWRVF